MNQYAVLLSIPGLRERDLSAMPRLSGLAEHGVTKPLIPSFPCMTCPVQVSLTTGVGPEVHGVTANGFFWRDKSEVEMWTSWNEVIETPQIWERLSAHDSSLTSAVWFPLLSKGAKADYVCTFAPIHNPDGSESLWCYTVPTEMYGDLRDEFGHFPLKHFWGPLAGIPSTDWIVNSAIYAARKYAPRFWYIYLPHLDYAAQKFGPDSPEAIHALSELDGAIGRLVDGFRDAGMQDTLWLAAGEYAITPAEGVSYPNRILREAGWLELREENGQEHLIPGESRAFALADHQLAHIYVRNAADIEQVAQAFHGNPDIAHVLVGEDRGKFGINHPRSGEIVLISQPEKWFAYYWWQDDDKAPDFARTVDIHRKPGYDPVEMYLDRETMSTPLDATLVKGTHGYPAETPERYTVLLSSNANVFTKETETIRDVDVAGIVLRNFGVKS
ncbi:MAG: alkaline phosphatase family protein [Planctomycetaceae bacterium]